MASEKIEDKKTKAQLRAEQEAEWNRIEAERREKALQEKINNTYAVLGLDRNSDKSDKQIINTLCDSIQRLQEQIRDKNRELNDLYKKIAHSVLDSPQVFGVGPFGMIAPYKYR